MTLPRDDAEQVDTAVQRYAVSGEGRVLSVGSERRLYVGGYCVAFFVADGVMYVDQVRRA